MNVSNHNTRRGEFYRGETWISNTIDWEYSSNLSLISISSYVVLKKLVTFIYHSVRKHSADPHEVNTQLSGYYNLKRCKLNGMGLD